MTDFSKMLEQAKNMQNKMKETQESIKKIEVEGVAAGGSIKIYLNGDGELIKLHMAPEIMKESKEILESNWLHVINCLITWAGQNQYSITFLI